MSLIDAVKVLPRKYTTDERGWFLKTLTGYEEDLSEDVGEIYITLTHAGQVRGNHYHVKTREWFTVIEGTAILRVTDPTSGESRQWTLSAEVPVTLFVPELLAHAFINPPTAVRPMLLLAYANQRYDPTDTFVFPVIESPD